MAYLVYYGLHMWTFGIILCTISQYGGFSKVLHINCYLLYMFMVLTLLTLLYRHFKEPPFGVFFLFVKLSRNHCAYPCAKEKPRRYPKTVLLNY